MRRVAGYVAKRAGMATKWAGMLAKGSRTQPGPGVHAYSVLVGIRLVGLKEHPSHLIVPATKTDTIRNCIGIELELNVAQLKH